MVQKQTGGKKMWGWAQSFEQQLNSCWCPWRGGGTHLDWERCLVYSCRQTPKLSGSRLRHWLREVRSWGEHSSVTACPRALCGTYPGAAKHPKPRGTSSRTCPALTSFFMPGGQFGVARERKEGK